MAGAAVLVCNVLSETAADSRKAESTSSATTIYSIQKKFDLDKDLWSEEV